MITLEEGELRPGGPCESCGAPTTVVRGFVYRDGDAHAVYFASWSECTPRFAKLALVTGPWGEDGADVSARRLVGMDADYSAPEPGLRVTGPDASPWNALSIAPPMLTREQALGLPDLEDLFHVADHVVLEDSRLAAFLDG